VTFSSSARRGLAIFTLAVFVRLLHLLLVMPTPVFHYHESFTESDMHMFDAWGRRIADGDVLGRAPYQPLYGWQLSLAPESRWREWYGDPHAFYKAPLYPYLLGALRLLFGEPMLPLALLQILASGLSALLIARLTARGFGAPAGFAAALLFAVYAPAIHYDVIMLRGPLIGLASLLATELLARLRERPSPIGAGLVGAATALALLLNEGFGPVPPLILLTIMAWFGAGRRCFALGLGFLGGLALGLAPVVVRNAIVGAPPLQLAVTGSTVYAVFNSAGANPYAFDIRPQTVAPIIAAGGGRLAATALACLRSFPSPGAVLLFYARKAAGLLIPFENPDNANFYYVALKDPLLARLPGYGTLLPLAIVGFVLARRRWRELGALAPFSLALLASILLTVTLSRYRVVLAVFLFPLAGVALARIVAWLAERRLPAAALALSACLALGGASLALQGVVLAASRDADVGFYRPSEFMLGADFYARLGRLDAAIAELLELARRNPDPWARASALLRAAQLQARKGDRATARDSLELAELANPRDAALLMAVGDLRRDLISDPAAAALAYRRALALAPPEPLAGALRERLARVAAPQAMR
jgi:4-amino-4-deoxy-L-arabinose transferase-like glycosyltransferase